jgi:hypothetical protein
MSYMVRHEQILRYARSEADKLDVHLDGDDEGKAALESLKKGLEDFNNAIAEKQAKKSGK